MNLMLSNLLAALPHPRNQVASCLPSVRHPASLFPTRANRVPGSRSVSRSIKGVCAHSAATTTTAGADLAARFPQASWSRMRRRPVIWAKVTALRGQPPNDVSAHARYARDAGFSAASSLGVSLARFLSEGTVT